MLLRFLSLLLLASLDAQPNPRPPGGIGLGALEVTDSTVRRTLRSSRTPPGTALEWTVRAIAGDVNTWTGLPTGLVVAADTLALFVKNTSWDVDSTQFCAEAWNRRGSQRSTETSILCWWEKKPAVLPPPGPIRVDSGPTPPDPTAAFFDDFRTGAKSGPQNGVAWGGGNCGPAPDRCPEVVPFGTGHALRFTFGATVGTADDAWSEQRFNLPAGWETFFVCMDWVYGSNYKHRRETASTNNKGLRVWNFADHTQADMLVGFSTWALDTTNVDYGKSQIQIDLRGSNGTGPWGQGPYTRFGPGQVRIAYFVQAGTTGGFGSNGTPVGQGGNGVIRVWVNGAKVYDRSDLTITSASGDRTWGAGYIQGWWNAGPEQTTDVYLERVWFNPQPIGICTTA